MRVQGPMVHISQQFTPPQLLEAGHRAEVEGRLDLAAQFYRHLTEHFAFTAEAAEARNGLGRVGATQSQVWHLNGAAHANGATRPQRRRPVAPRDHYRGRALARLVSTLGWLSVICGSWLPAFTWRSIISHRPRPSHVSGWRLSWPAQPGSLAPDCWSCSQARSPRPCDRANAARDLVALERRSSRPPRLDGSRRHDKHSCRKG